MKRILLVLMACFPVIGLMAAEVEPLAGDTIITLERKRIEVKDNGDRMKVRVYEVDEDGDSVDDELIFEGHYRDGQSYERRKHVKSINIPVPTWDKDFNPHWAGFGMGFANFADGSLHVNDVDGVSLRSGNSLEYNLNVLEKYLVSMIRFWFWCRKSPDGGFVQPSASSMAYMTIHSSICALFPMISGQKDSSILSSVTHQFVSTTNFFFSHSFFWKFSIWARKSMMILPTRLTAFTLAR